MSRAELSGAESFFWNLALLNPKLWFYLIQNIGFTKKETKRFRQKAKGKRMNFFFLKRSRVESWDRHSDGDLKIMNDWKFRIYSIYFQGFCLQMKNLPSWSDQKTSKKSEKFNNVYYTQFLKCSSLHFLKLIITFIF